MPGLASRFTLALSLVGSAAGCWTTVRPTLADLETEPEGDTPLTVASAPVQAKPAPAPSALAADNAVATVERLVPSLRFTDLEDAGIDEASRRQLVADAQADLSGCGAQKGDTVEVALFTSEGDIATRLKTANADDAVAACVVRKLAIDIDNVLQPSPNSPSERFPTVQSVVTIQF